MIGAAGKTIGVLTFLVATAMASGTAFLFTSPDIKRFYDVADARRTKAAPSIPVA